MGTAWTEAQGKKRHLAYAKELAGAGFTWRALTISDWPQVTPPLVQAHIAGCDTFEFDGDSGGVVAVDSSHNIVGAAVITLVQVEATVVVFLRHLVVDPASRGLGIGLVTLGLLPQAAETATPIPLSLTIGKLRGARWRFLPPRWVYGSRARIEFPNLPGAEKRGADAFVEHELPGLDVPRAVACQKAFFGSNF